MPLTSPLLLVLLACTAEALLYLALRRSTSTRWPLRAGAAATAALLVLAGAAAWTNDHYGFYRSWRDLTGVHSRDLVVAHDPLSVARAAAPAVSQTNAKHGTLLELDIPAPLAGIKPRRAFVYLPPQYRDPLYASTSFPVVEALQGSPGRPSDWILGLHLDQELDRGIALGNIHPSIVVIPDTNGGLARSLECTNTKDGIADETFLTTDVRSWINKTFRAEPGRWVAVGYSTGGYCSVDLALRNPRWYASAISLDGYTQAISDHYARHLWRSREDRLEHSPDWWVTHRPPERVDLYLLAGADDHSSVRAATRFWNLLGEHGWRRPHDALVAQPHGRHTFPDWQAALQPALEWALPGINAPRDQPRPAATFAPYPMPSPHPAKAASPRASVPPSTRAGATGSPRPGPSASTRPARAPSPTPRLTPQPSRSP
ncbi:MAG: Endo,4-beta-xylanase [Frankiales bacterium]|nr:Endo,4-beta-xylanase [Frankiales bacterium]